MELTEKIDKWIKDNEENITDELSGLIHIKNINNPPGGNEKLRQNKGFR